MLTLDDYNKRIVRPTFMARWGNTANGVKRLYGAFVSESPFRRRWLLLKLWAGKVFRKPYRPAVCSSTKTSWEKRQQWLSQRASWPDDRGDGHG